MKNSWVQIVIVHEKGHGIIGNGNTYVSKFHNLPKVPKDVPVLDLQKVPMKKWQKVLMEYTYAGNVLDVDELVAKLNALKKIYDTL